MGPLVLNRPGWERWQQFETARPLDNEIDRRLLKLGLLQPEQQQLTRQRVKPDVLTVWLQVTNACNLNCLYCYKPPVAAALSAEGGEKALAGVLRYAARQGFHKVKLKYAGGEPTLAAERVLQLSRSARSLAAGLNLGLDQVLLTNATLLDAARISQIAAEKLRVSISIDGLAAVNDAQRRSNNGVPAFDRVVRALDLLQQAGLAPSVTVTLTRLNLAGLPEVVRFLLERGLRFGINFYRPASAGLEALALCPQPGELVRAVQTAFAVIEAALPLDWPLTGLLDRVRLDHAHDVSCGVGESYLVIDCQGRVSACQMDLDEPVGLPDEPDLPAKLKQAAARYGARPVTEQPACAECEWRFACAGGCPRLSVAGRPLYCAAYQALIPDLIRLEGLRLLRNHEKKDGTHVAAQS